jgi:hypothetical protein
MQTHFERGAPRTGGCLENVPSKRAKCGSRSLGDDDPPVLMFQDGGIQQAEEPLSGMCFLAPEAALRLL